jgi:polar amino acid transport system permease protein
VSSTWTPSERELERRRIRRQDKVRRTALATTITIVVFAIVWFAVTNSGGWPTVKATFFSWEDMKKAFPSIIKGFWLNIRMFLAAEVLILIVGTLVAVVRQSRSPWLTPLRIVAVAYTDIFRGIPTILLILYICFGVPALKLSGVPTNVFWLATFALVLSYGAYVAEVLRAGILSIHPSQLASAEALALSRPQTMRHVVLPQAVRRVLPPLLNDFVSLQKDTALASTAAVFESLFAAMDYSNYHFNFTGYTVAAILFVLLTIPLARLTDWLMIRQMRRDFGR